MGSVSAILGWDVLVLFSCVLVSECLFVNAKRTIYKLYHGEAKKKICVFPIAWSSKLGSVGRDLIFFFFYIV